MQKTINPLIFCQQQWKLGALVLLVLLSITALGGFYLYDLKYGNTEFQGEYIKAPDSDSMAGFLTNPTLQQLNTQQQLASSVVSIQSGGDYSSGAIIHPDGYIVSVLHSIKNSKDIQITVRDSLNTSTIKHYKGEILKQLPEHDIVLIKMVTKEKFPYIQLSETPFKKTSVIYSLGRTETGQFIMKDGNISDKELTIRINNKKLTNLLQSNAVYTWEQNGGPVVDLQGQLIGINLAIKDTKGQVHGLLIPVTVLNIHLLDVIPAKAKKAVVRNLQSQSNKPKTMAAAWWDNARQEVNQESQQAVGNTANNQGQLQNTTTNTLAMNVAFAEPQHAPTAPLSFLDVGNKHPLKIGAYELNDLLALLLGGIIVGIMGFVSPLSGGLFLMIIMYAAMGYDFYLARPVIFATLCFIYAVMTIRYRMDKSADRLFAEHPVILQLPFIIVGTVLGFVAANLIVDEITIVLLALSALLLVINHSYQGVIENLFLSLIHKTPLLEKVQTVRHAKISDQYLEDNTALELLTRNEEEEKHSKHWFNRVLASVPMAFTAGMLNVYNGALFFQQQFNNFSRSKAQAHTTQQIFFITLTGLIASIIHGMENELFKLETPFLLAIIIIPSIFGGAFVANYLLKFISQTVLLSLTLLILVASTGLLLNFLW